MIDTSLSMENMEFTIGSISLMDGQTQMQI